MDDKIFDLNDLVKKIEDYVRKEKNPFVDFYLESDKAINYMVEARMVILEDILYKISIQVINNTDSGYILMGVKQLERGMYNSLIEFIITYTGERIVEDKNSALTINQLVESVYGFMLCERDSDKNTRLLLRIPFKIINEAKLLSGLDRENFNFHSMPVPKN